MLNDTNGPHFTEYFSVWKVTGLEIALFLMSVLPMVPNFGNGLVYTAFFYRTEFFLILATGCGFLGFLFLCILPLLFRAIFQRPALEAFGKVIKIYGFSARMIQIGDIDQNFGERFGSIKLEIGRNKPAIIPIFLYRNTPRALRRLRNLING